MSCSCSYVVVPSEKLIVMCETAIRRSEDLAQRLRDDSANRMIARRESWRRWLPFIPSLSKEDALKAVRADTWHASHFCEYNITAEELLIAAKHSTEVSVSVDDLNTIAG